MKWLVFMLALVTACTPGTGGRRAVFALAVTPAESPRSFRTALGWDVTLAEACVSVGPVHLYAGTPPTALHRVHDWLVPSAHAHPGVDHFDGGEVRGEWLEQIAVDLMAPRQDLGAREGIAGDIREVTLGLHPPRPGTFGAADCLRGHQAWVSGRAVRGDVVVSFEGGLDIPAEGTKRRLQIPATVAIDDDRRIVIAVEPRHWLEQAKLDELPVDPGSGKAVIGKETQAALAWELGLQTAGAFRIDEESR